MFKIGDILKCKNNASWANLRYRVVRDEADYYELKYKWNGQNYQSSMSKSAAHKTLKKV